MPNFNPGPVSKDTAEKVSRIEALAVSGLFRASEISEAKRRLAQTQPQGSIGLEGLEENESGLPRLPRPDFNSVLPSSLPSSPTAANGQTRNKAPASPPIAAASMKSSLTWATSVSVTSDATRSSNSRVGQSIDEGGDVRRGRSRTDSGADKIMLSDLRKRRMLTSVRDASTSRSWDLIPGGAVKLVLVVGDCSSPQGISDLEVIFPLAKLYSLLLPMQKQSVLSPLNGSSQLLSLLVCRLSFLCLL